MNQVIAMHGWSEDSNFWEAWEKSYQEHGWIWQSGERGYGSHQPVKPQWKDSKRVNASQCRAVIVHSLGAHLIEKKVLENATAIVFLCSFGRFVPESKENRQLKAGLKGMYNKLGTNKEQDMIAKFLAKASSPEASNMLPTNSIPHNISEKGRQKLKEDLNILIEATGLPDGVTKEAKVLVINGREDAIVCTKARELLMKDLQNNNQKSIELWDLPNAGHILFKENLRSLVRDWLESCK